MMTARKMFSMRFALGSTLLALVLPGLARAQGSSNDDDDRNPRVRILVNGLYNATSLSFGESSTFESFLEQATTRRDYDGGKGFAFEGGVIVNLTSSIGVMASFESFEGDLDATFSEQLPHPLYFNQPRSVSGELTGLSYSERAIHVDFVFTRALDVVTIDIFAGPTFFTAEAELISDVKVVSDYPFDEAVVSSTSRTKVDDNPIGFNAGGSLTFRLSRVFGVAVQARYSTASATISRPGGSDIDFDAGGFHVGGGIRIAF